MDDTTKHAFLEEHIPYRMCALDAVRWAWELLHEQPPPQAARLLIDDRDRVVCDVRAFTNPLVEAGAMAGRVLLAFMGLGLDKKNRALSSLRPTNSDDVSLESFNLPLLNPSAVARHGPHAASDCAEVIQVTHKGIAHLTDTDRAGGEAFAKIRRAADLIPILVCESLYDGLQIPRPPFTWG